MPMKLCRRKQPCALWLFSALLLLNGCEGEELDCDSLETRNSMVKIVSDDGNNALVNYAVKSSSSVAAIGEQYKYRSGKNGGLGKSEAGRDIHWMIRYLQIQEAGQRER